MKTTKTTKGPHYVSERTGCTVHDATGEFEGYYEVRDSTGAAFCFTPAWHDAVAQADYHRGCE